MKKFFVLLAIMTFAISVIADSPLLTTQKKVELQNKEKKQYRPRSVAPEAVDCWYADGVLTIIAEPGESIKTIRITDVNTGNITTDHLPVGTRTHTLNIGTSSVIIEIALANGDEYEGSLFQ